MKTPKKLINKYTTKKQQFKSIAEAERYIRKNGTPDFITVDGLLYTMEEYDIGGQNIIYYNLRSHNQINVRTTNRYRYSGLENAIVELTENFGAWRNDITFAD